MTRNLKITVLLYRKVCQREGKNKMNVKQIIVIRKDLKMRRGKEIAQGAHASMKVFFDRMQTQRHEGLSADGKGPGYYTCHFSISEVEQAWVNGAFTKIAVSVDSEQQLLDVYRKALELRLPAALITDSGRTEFHGVPTHTAVAVGPALADDIDKITGELKLL
jgi:PTH2 family peptidyl-tRNA hydrolase